MSIGAAIASRLTTDEKDVDFVAQLSIDPDLHSRIVLNTLFESIRGELGLGISIVLSDVRDASLFTTLTKCMWMLHQWSESLAHLNVRVIFSTINQEKLMIRI